MGDCRSAHQEVPGVLILERAAQEDGVSLDDEVVEIGRVRAVNVDAVAEPREHDVVGDVLGPGLVLGIDAVAVSAVRTFPAVVVDQAPVDLGIGPGGERADALTRVVNRQVHEPDSRIGAVAAVDAIAAADVGRPGSGLRRHALRVGARDFEAPEPRVRSVDRENGDAVRVPAVERRALAGILAHDDRGRRRAVEVTGEGPGVGAAPKPDRVSGMDGRGLIQGLL